MDKGLTLHDNYSADSIEEMVQLHRNLTKYEKMLGGSWPYWYKDNIMDRRITHMILNSLLYLQEVQMKYVYKDLIKKFVHLYRCNLHTFY